MKSFEIVSHTADVRIKACGDSLISLFESALDGLIEILQPDINSLHLENAIKIEISVKSFDTTALLIDFLSEALTQMYIKNVIIKEVKFTKITSDSFSAILTAYPCDKFAVDIKAVTYHEAEISQNKFNEYVSTIVLDL